MTALADPGADAGADADAYEPRHVLVVVPAHDEARALPNTLAAIEAARRQLPASIGSTLVVVADGCADDTAAIARAAGRPTDVVVDVARHGVGAARRLGTERGLHAVGLPHRRVWIANTDADTLVPADWLVAHVAHARRGLIAVAGTVALARERRPGGPTDELVRRRFAQRYRLGDDGTHTHVHGANLGVRADAYAAAGGWSSLTTAEDHDLWRRLVALGPTASPSALRVATSARLRGRAPRGFAVGLAELAAGTSLAEGRAS